jgi:hypothetical protein
MGRSWDDTGTVDQVNSASQGDILPNLLNKLTASIGRQSPRTLVSPGTGATRHTLPLFRVLMTLLLPTFGYPMKPTEICFLSEWS